MPLLAKSSVFAVFGAPEESADKSPHSKTDDRGRKERFVNLLLPAPPGENRHGNSMLPSPVLKKGDEHRRRKPSLNLKLNIGDHND
jgi:hypothetical protein